MYLATPSYSLVREGSAHDAPSVIQRAEQSVGRYLDIREVNLIECLVTDDCPNRPHLDSVARHRHKQKRQSLWTGGASLCSAQEKTIISKARTRCPYLLTVDDEDIAIQNCSRPQAQEDPSLRLARKIPGTTESRLG